MTDEVADFERPLHCTECSLQPLRFLGIRWLPISQFWSYWICPSCRSTRVLLNDEQQPIPTSATVTWFDTPCYNTKKKKVRGARKNRK